MLLQQLFMVWLFIAQCTVTRPCLGYKPVIIVHGLFDSASTMEDIVDHIEKVHPGTLIHNVNLFDNSNSLTAMPKQLKAVGNDTRSFMQMYKEGVHLLGFSQGGLLARGLVQSMNDHNVQNFIALSSPLNGQFGDTSYVNKILPGMTKEYLHEVLYTDLGQKLSIGNYWKDPHHFSEYEKYSNFLAPLNNESVSKSFHFPIAWKQNVARLKNMILIGGPDDGVIAPWQSAHFGCFDAAENVVDIRDLKIYQNDVFGLKSLDKAGRLHQYTVPGVAHTHWHVNKQVFTKYIEPWLT